ncbi:hypothetical protein BC830DRAFT_1175657 [Chytriomyces sp. MP71]|nr:hypothetical protein BC830DRAFT_1175657 [Chytriomyces sp. MP71]
MHSLVPVCETCLPQARIPRSMLFDASRCVLRRRCASSSDLVVSCEIGGANDETRAFEYPVLVVSDNASGAFSRLGSHVRRNTLPFEGGSRWRDQPPSLEVAQNHDNVDTQSGFSLGNCDCLCHNESECACGDLMSCRCFACHNRRMRSLAGITTPSVACDVAETKSFEHVRSYSRDWSALDREVSSLCPTATTHTKPNTNCSAMRAAKSSVFIRWRAYVAGAALVASVCLRVRAEPRWSGLRKPCGASGTALPLISGTTQLFNGKKGAGMPPTTRRTSSFSLSQAPLSFDTILGSPIATDPPSSTPFTDPSLAPSPATDNTAKNKAMSSHKWMRRRSSFGLVRGLESEPPVFRAGIWVDVPATESPDTSPGRR